MIMQKNLLWAKHIMVIIVSLVFFNACDQKEQVVEEAEILRPVKFMVVSSPESEGAHIYSGSLKAGSELNRSFKVSGTVQSIPVKVGDRLKKNDIIATLDKASYELQVAKSRASLAQSQAEKRNADSKYNRTKGLYANNNTSKDALESSRANAETARAQVSSSEKSLELALLDQAYATLKATQDCAVAQVLVEVNENVTSGAPIMTLSCGDVNEIAVSLPESIISNIEKGMVATVRFDTIADTLFSAHVTEVGVASSNATYPVALVLNKTHSKLRSGLVAEVSFQFSNGAASLNRLYLPPGVVNKDTEGSFVFTLKPGQKQNVAIVQRRAVEVGEITSMGLEIVSGLEVGTKVVTAGISVIRDGLRVKAQ